jgi:hypothetical protein
MAALALGALLSSGCRGKASIAPGLTDAALMTLRNGMSTSELRAKLGEPLAVLVRPGEPRPEATVSRWTYASAACRASVGPAGFGCVGVSAEATFVGDTLQVFSVKDMANGFEAFECSDVNCPRTSDQGHLRYLLERQRGR